MCWTQCDRGLGLLANRIILLTFTATAYLNTSTTVRYAVVMISHDYRSTCGLDSFILCELENRDRERYLLYLLKVKFKYIYLITESLKV